MSRFPTILDASTDGSPWNVGMAKLALILSLVLTCSPTFGHAEVVSVETYGAVGDGVANDAPALQKAIQDLAARKQPGVVAFQQGKKYRLLPDPAVSTNALQWAMSIKGMKDIELRGHGAVLLPATPLSVFSVVQSEDITISGFTIDYLPRPYIVGDVVSVDKDGSCFDLRVAEGEPLPVLDAPDVDDNSGMWNFLIPIVEGRHHMYVKSVKEISPELTKQRIFRVSIRPDASSAGRLSILDVQKPGIWLPNPGVGHQRGGVAHVGGSGNVRFENITVRSGPSFLFSIKGNDGPISFRKVVIAPERTDGRGMVAWRDGFHCKNNRGPLTWDDCQIQGLHDDAFNLSLNWMKIQKVVSETEWQIARNESSVRVGDTLSIVDSSAGILLGKRLVTETRQVSPAEFIITLDAPVSLQDPNVVLIANENAAHPGSRISNCTVQGTARFRANVLVDSLDLTGFMWIDAYGVEGPVPHDLLFRNCRLTSPLGGDVMTISSFGSEKIWDYAPSNIVFERCNISGKRRIQPNADVRFVDSSENGKIGNNN